MIHDLLLTSLDLNIKKKWLCIDLTSMLAKYKAFTVSVRTVRMIHTRF